MVYILIVNILILPLLLVKNISRLRYFNLFGFIGILYLALLVTI